MHSIIKAYLFNVWVVCFTLIAGGAVLLWVDQLELKPKYNDIMHVDTNPAIFSSDVKYGGITLRDVDTNPDYY